MLTTTFPHDTLVTAPVSILSYVGIVCNPCHVKMFLQPPVAGGCIECII